VKEKLLNARSARDLVSEDLERDPEFRLEWERSALARVVALVVVGYRAKHKLSQRKLAELLGWKPSQVARLWLPSGPDRSSSCDGRLACRGCGGSARNLSGAERRVQVQTITPEILAGTASSRHSAGGSAAS
jgi:hypothetical protein